MEMNDFNHLKRIWFGELVPWNQKPLCVYVCVYVCVSVCKKLVEFPSNLEKPSHVSFHFGFDVRNALVVSQPSLHLHFTYFEKLPKELANAMTHNGQRF